MARPEWSKAKMSWSYSALTCVALNKKLSYAKWPLRKELAFVKTVWSTNLSSAKWPLKEIAFVKIVISKHEPKEEFTFVEISLVLFCFL